MCTGSVCTGDNQSSGNEKETCTVRWSIFSAKHIRPPCRGSCTSKTQRAGCLPPLNVSFDLVCICAAMLLLMLNNDTLSRNYLTHSILHMRMTKQSRTRSGKVKLPKEQTKCSMNILRIRLIRIVMVRPASNTQVTTMICPSFSIRRPLGNFFHLIMYGLLWLIRTCHRIGVTTQVTKKLRHNCSTLLPHKDTM